MDIPMLRSWGCQLLKQVGKLYSPTSLQQCVAIPKRALMLLSQLPPMSKSMVTVKISY